LTRFRRRPENAEWLGLGEASRILGVAPGTLRRWSDDGTVSAFTTPGGHRRYRRSVLENMLPSERAARSLRARAAITPARLSRAYRQEARHVGRTLPWVTRLADADREWFRAHGRLLAEALLNHLDPEDAEAGRDGLVAASAEAGAYGRKAADLGVALGDAVEGFLQFRRPFLNQLGLLAARRSLDAAQTSELMDKATRAMDQLLMAAMAGHSVKRVATPYEPSDRVARLI
jgi:hypothetical protein